jgi:hypothetical protein
MVWPIMSRDAAAILGFTVNQLNEDRLLTGQRLENMGVQKVEALTLN